MPALILGFCWGAGMAVITTLVLGSWVQPLLMAGMPTPMRTWWAPSSRRRWWRRSARAPGLLLLFFLRRRTFDGPIDGVVYAGIIAAGFAFTENILYFGKHCRNPTARPAGWWRSS